jgi:hypothetical protein
LHGQSLQDPAKEIQRTASIARLLEPFVVGDHVRLPVQMALVGRFQDRVLKINVDGWAQRYKHDLFKHYQTVWDEWSKHQSGAMVRSDLKKDARALDAKHSRIRQRLGQLSLDGIIARAEEDLGTKRFAEVLNTAEGKLEELRFGRPKSDEQRKVLRDFLDDIRTRVQAWKTDRDWQEVQKDLAALDRFLARIGATETPLGETLDDYLTRTVKAAVDPEVQGRLRAYALVNPLYASLLGADHLVKDAIGLRETVLKKRMNWIDARFRNEDCTLRFIRQNDDKRERGDEFLIEQGLCTGVRFSKRGLGNTIVEIPPLGKAKYVFLVPRDRVRIRFKLGGSTRPEGAVDLIWVESLNLKEAEKIDLRLPRRGVAGFEFFQTATQHCWVSEKPITRDRIRQGYLAMHESSSEPWRVKEEFAALWNASKPRQEKESDPDKVATLDDPAWMNQPFVIDSSTRKERLNFFSGLFSVGKTSILNAAPQFRGERLPDNSLANDLSRLMPFVAKHGLVDASLFWVPDRVQSSIDPGRRGRPIYTVLLMH